MDEDLILQYHCIAFEKWTSEHEYRWPVQMIKDQVNNYVKGNEKSKARDFIERCSRELGESFAIVKTLLQSNISSVLDIFALNRAAVSYSLLIKAYKLDDSEKKQDFKRVARLLEIICFRLGIGGYRVDRGRNRLYELGKNFKGDFNSLINKLKDFAGSSGSDGGFCNNNDFQRCLSSASFHKDVNRNDQLYLFWKYENHLRTNQQPLFPKMSYSDFVNKNPQAKFSIEHIIPQNPQENNIVKEESKLILPTPSQEFEEKYLHSIGNLTIDPLSANISKSNQGFEYKAQNYFRRAPLTTQNELIDFFNTNTEKWDEVSISERKKKILEFALDYWNPEKV